MLKTYILALLRNKIIFHRALHNEKANIAVFQFLNNNNKKI